MKKYVILHPTGRISRLVIKHLLADPQFSDVELELLTQRPELLADLAKGGRIKLTEGAATDLDYTLIRMLALTDWPDVKYSLTGRYDEFVGTSVSRASVADLVLKIMADPSRYSRASVGISQPETAGYVRPVY
ncbi:NAD(P)H-binding protein [Lactobacillus delbrueckii subsp. bulgaricus]|uniref:NAD(P)H-binding protein n=1 Tax=Lactobacillus delbrueckii TaxID=1584 RepID=UPI001C1E5B08|nr:NAD(P)H-binding protein [Lactobacillus delbrueckii]MBU6048702.1 NAD(P)H-binding protein [Lactobacillus delbrueckii]MCD5461518.1 NAD(P)H-binding protein [Lactobacillus delbrueckii subsp. bulgaricus]MCD5477001.1 NAD(P)H-binding protein [Lactobacillus delbrueckii subsp. bulgaricus]MCT3477826.1 nucleoside-diphosphate sugar epimerase [Lactobacillus delbrueckii subsp. bulgaricus]MCT3480070.1 nucleoside-diphosphate sugar epimerase [Lactobacillus delbrueckii subsp. bulgaricus]